MAEHRNCIYCNDTAGREALMLPAARLEVSELFLMRDQRYPGRCVVVFEEHKVELFELAPAQLAAFMGDVARAAEAVLRLFGAEKINYAIYGDLVPHLHLHVVPKRRDGAAWGEPFINSGPAPLLLAEAAYAESIAKLQDRLCRRNRTAL